MNLVLWNHNKPLWFKALISKDHGLKHCQLLFVEVRILMLGIGESGCGFYQCLPAFVMGVAMLAFVEMIILAYIATRMLKKKRELEQMDNVNDSQDVPEELEGSIRFNLQVAYLRMIFVKQSKLRLELNAHLQSYIGNWIESICIGVYDISIHSCSKTKTWSSYNKNCMLYFTCLKYL